MLSRRRVSFRWCCFRGSRYFFWEDSGRARDCERGKRGRLPSVIHLVSIACVIASFHSFICSKRNEIAREKIIQSLPFSAHAPHTAKLGHFMSSLPNLVANDQNSRHNCLQRPEYSED